ncbi:hypothetical protein [Companilactobacillus farciminis]|uniref:hypothetical protein n=1 Tax=Companilactobacillus farciminis TaxID=1612 RepID=UPI00232C37BC|nr:hypothetical protein [Companilactobacillus farciminis]WCG35012.1 hypothetical protein PML84_09275 [Companilactobacillus farciminis]
MDKKMVPEVRFKGFSDDWEQHKFQEILDKNNGIRRGPFGSSLKKIYLLKTVIMSYMNNKMQYTIIFIQDILLQKKNFKS